MPHKRSPGKLEQKKARSYVFRNLDRPRDPDDPPELVFTGTADDIKEAVLLELKGVRSGEIPEYPQGLVVSDRRGEGYFDVVPFFLENLPDGGEK